MKKINNIDLNENFVEINGEKLHASLLKKKGERILIDSRYPYVLGLRTVPGEDVHKTGFRLVDTKKTSWRREVVKRVKYALKKNVTAEIAVAKGRYGGDGPGSFDNRGGYQTVHIKGQSDTLTVPIASTCDEYGEERKWARNWYTPLDEVWSTDFELWLESDRIASVILKAMAEVICHRWGENEVKLDISELNREFFSLYSSIAGHKPAFEGEVIGY